MQSMNDLRVGIDLVRVSHIADSIARFGNRFLKRIFTEGEIAYAYASGSPVVRAERLAARFAAKEAALKALALANVGVSWTDLEVLRDSGGACSLKLHGKALQSVCSRGECQIALSLSHSDEYATAIVVATAIHLDS
jgi:holo-[acyl-carrier protein] synthase